jgi:subtilisin family serine protease
MQLRITPARRSAVLVAGALAALSTIASAQTTDASHLRIPDGAALSVTRTPAVQSHGSVDVVVTLADAPLAARQGAGAKQHGNALTRAQAHAYLDDLRNKQDAFMARAQGLGAKQLARLSRALNAVVVSVDASQLGAVASIPGVVSVRPVGNYEMSLSETVPYIGASAAQAAGKDGTGVKVAVLDSGVDYTHRNLGGAGTTAAYQTAYAARDSAYAGFPTAKVYGGFDFVGDKWPNGDRTEDPNPIDAQGHGTHVADIIGGKSLDGQHVGVAPGAKLMALKVCSAVATSCNGVALLKAVEYALDPNGDDDMSDSIDVMNLSLGSSYGQKEDDLSSALANAVRYGVVVVAAAGNDANKPYIVSSPSSTPEVISVAQTQVPSASALPLVINSPANIAGTYGNTATIDWAPVDGGFTGNVAYVGRGCNADAYQADPSGKVALIDRGACNVSEKVRRASDAGAIGVLIGLVAAGDAVTFSNGGQCPAPADGTCKASLVITQADANKIKTNLGASVNVTVSPDKSIALVGSMVGSSARGPSMSYNAINPDVGAPGASVSAIVGTGTGEEAFGGTSGATPMVAGSAAILRQAYPERSPAEIKALLMNTAETQITTNPAVAPGVLAPITRIGGGEVRVKRALDSTLAAFDAVDMTGSLSFGYQTIVADQTFKKTVTVKNYGNQSRTLAIAPSFRFANDQASNAVSFKAPSSISVPAGGSASFDVMLKLKASALPLWNLNGGSQGGNGGALDLPEYDGYITLSDAAGNVHVAWQVLPHKSADIAASTTSVNAGKSVTLANNGATAGRVDVFALTGTSPKIQKFFLPGDGDNFAIIDLKSVGTRLVSLGGGEYGLQFAINTFGERAHPNYPAEFDVYIDTDGDGKADYVAYNAENGGFGATGQNVVNLVNLRTGASKTAFYTDADLNSANAILTVALSDLGITPATPITFDVYAFDNYFTGNLTDAITGMTITPGVPRYVASGIPSSGIAAGGRATMSVSSIQGGDAASPAQSGLLLLYRDGKLKNQAQTIAVSP